MQPGKSRGQPGQAVVRESYRQPFPNQMLVKLLTELPVVIDHQHMSHRIWSSARAWFAKPKAQRLWVLVMACNNQDAGWSSNVVLLVQGHCKKSTYNSLTISRKRTRVGGYDQAFRK